MLLERVPTLRNLQLSLVKSNQGNSLLYPFKTPNFLQKYEKRNYLPNAIIRQLRAKGQIRFLVYKCPSHSHCYLLKVLNFL